MHCKNNDSLYQIKITENKHQLIVLRLLNSKPNPHQSLNLHIVGKNRKICYDETWKH